MKKRYFPKKEKGVPKGYDSMLEYNLHTGPLKGCEHHSRTVNYIVKHTYEADFVPVRENNILIEAKGRFQDSAAASKYKWIRDCNPDLEIVFVFEKRGTRFPFAKKRKDGTYMTNEEWCDKEGFRYYYPDTLPKKWSK